VCGQITLTRPNLESIASELNVEPMHRRGMPLYKPRYNVAPTDAHPILTLGDDGQRQLSTMTWGASRRAVRV
jgi:putative SOS response-associated peptidase YedK